MQESPLTSAESLLREAKAGTPDCLGALLQLYGNYLKVLAAGQLDRRLSARIGPSDIVQETLLEAHRDFAAFRGTTRQEFLAWLRKILVNNLSRTAERHLHAAKRDVRREVAIPVLTEALNRSAGRLEAVLADSATSPSSNFDRQENALIVADQLAELPRDYREVLTMRHLQGMSFDEIAECLNRSPGAARMLWLRAVEALRKGLRLRRQL